MNNNNNNNNNNNTTNNPPSSPSSTGGAGLAGSQPLVRNVTPVGFPPVNNANLIARSSPLAINTRMVAQAPASSNASFPRPPSFPTQSVIDHPLASHNVSSPPPTSDGKKSFSVNIHAAPGASDEIEIIKNSPIHKGMNPNQLRRKFDLNSPTGSNVIKQKPYNLEKKPAPAPASAPLPNLKQLLSSVGTALTENNVTATHSHEKNKSSQTVPAPRSLDEEVDAFFRGNINFGEPSPHNLVGIKLLIDLERRRSWSDILVVSC